MDVAASPRHEAPPTRDPREDIDAALYRALMPTHEQYWGEALNALNNGAPCQRLESAIRSDRKLATRFGRVVQVRAAAADRFAHLLNAHE